MAVAVESLIGSGTDDEFRGHIGAASAATVTALGATVDALVDDVAALAAPAGVAYAMARGGIGTRLTSTERVLVSRVDIPQALRVGDVLTIELPYVAKNLGTVAGDLILETYFAPTARGDLSYSFAGLSQTFPAPAAHSHGHLLHKYAIIAPGAALNMMGASGSNSGNHTYGKATSSGFLAEVPGSGVASYSDAYPLWTDGLLSLYVIAKQSSAEADDWLWLGPAEVHVVSAGAAGAGIALAAATPTTHTATLPGSTSFKGPALADMASGKPISGTGAVFAKVATSAASEAVWGFTADPGVPLFAQEWEFGSASSGTAYTLRTNPLIAGTQVPPTGDTLAAVIATLGAGAMTGDVSGQPALSYVTCPADGAKKALRFYGHAEDTPTAQTAGAGFRAEMACPPRVGDGLCSPGDEVWLAARLVFSSSGSVLALHSTSTCDIWQIHAGAISGPKNSPGLALLVWQGNLYLRRFFPTVDSYADTSGFTATSHLIATAPATNTAHTLVMRALLKGGSQHASGILQVWWNGTLVANVTGGTNYPEAQCVSHRPHTAHYMKVGVYSQRGGAAPTSENGHVHYRGMLMWRNPSAAVTAASAKAAIEAY